MVSVKESREQVDFVELQRGCVFGGAGEVIESRLEEASDEGSQNDSGAPDSCLTSREREILNLLSEGLSAADISRSLMITRSAVRVHIAAIVPKLGVPDAAQAVDRQRLRTRL
jgi:DNA-binding NarL/FixJ family response regulator